MLAAGAKICRLISKNMPENGKIDQKQTKKCLKISWSGKNAPQAKIFWVSHMIITSKPLKLIVLMQSWGGGKRYFGPPLFDLGGGHRPLAPPLDTPMIHGTIPTLPKMISNMC